MPPRMRPAVPVQLQRLETAFFGLKRPLMRSSLWMRTRRLRGTTCSASPANEAALDSSLAQLATNAALQQLGRETAAAFPDSAALRHDLGEMFRRVHHYFPDFRAPPAVHLREWVSGQGYLCERQPAGDEPGLVCGPQGQQAPRPAAVHAAPLHARRPACRCWRRT